MECDSVAAVPHEPREVPILNGAIEQLEAAPVAKESNEAITESSAKIKPKPPKPKPQSEIKGERK